MGKLIYAALASLDGYVADEGGNFDWAEPREDVHRFINDLEARNAAVVYGRKLYEVMLAWETWELEGLPAYIQDFARVWRRSPKIVYSTTLTEVKSANTTLRSAFDADELRAQVEGTDGAVGIGGAELAGHAFRAGLVDEVFLFLFPELVGGGTRALASGFRMSLTLVDTKLFENGVVLLHYARTTLRSRTPEA